MKGFLVLLSFLPYLLIYLPICLLNCFLTYFLTLSCDACLNIVTGILSLDDRSSALLSSLFSLHPSINPFLPSIFVYSFILIFILIFIFIFILFFILSGHKPKDVSTSLADTLAQPSSTGYSPGKQHFRSS
jgi:Na+-transporting NADH:ubiquinone oxidoreductase subunit NqrB